MIHRCSITLYISVCANLTRHDITTLAFNNSVAFTNMFSARGPLGLGNSEIDLWYYLKSTLHELCLCLWWNLTILTWIMWTNQTFEGKILANITYHSHYCFPLLTFHKTVYLCHILVQYVATHICTCYSCNIKIVT